MPRAMVARLSRPRNSLRALGALAALALSGLTAATALAAEDPHLTAGSPTAVPSLSWSGGVSAEVWSDPKCPPAQGVLNTDPGQAPSSWGAFLVDTVFGSNIREVAENAAQDVVGLAYDDYKANHLGSPPPEYSTKEFAQDKAKSVAMGALLSETFWKGLVLRTYPGITKPTAADIDQFLAHVTEYRAGVENPACDGRDGYRLYRSKPYIDDHKALWQLADNGPWAKLTYDAGAPQPPANAFYQRVPGSLRTYLVQVPAANPLGAAMVMGRIVGELRITDEAHVHACAVDESSSQSVTDVNANVQTELYNTLRGAMGWLPPTAPVARWLPVIDMNCATVHATYTEHTNGPLLPWASAAISDDGRYVAGYTVNSQKAFIARFQRDGAGWDAPTPFAGSVFNSGFDEVEPRVAISGDGNVVAGCWMSARPLTPIVSPFPLLPTNDYLTHYPLIFRFDNLSIAYSAAGPTDTTACSRVTLNTSGDTVWYQQRSVGTFRTPTALASPPPTVTVPADKTVEAVAPGGTPVTYTASANDANGPRPVSCSPTSGSIFPVARTTVTCTATNDAGAAAETFDVNVVDTTAPELAVPSNIVAEATGRDGAMVTFPAPTAEDLVDGSRPVGCSAQSGDRYAIGETTITCSASDTRANGWTASFTVTVADTTAPQLTVPDDIIAETTGPDGAKVTFATTASDVVDGTVNTMCAPASGHTFPLADTTVACEAEDAAGNRAHGSFKVTVVDTTAPTVTYSGNQPIYNVDDRVRITCHAADVSGVASTTCADLDAWAGDIGVGTHTLTALATDKANNTAAGSTTFTVARATATQTGHLMLLMVQDTAQHQLLSTAARRRVERAIADTFTAIAAARNTQQKQKALAAAYALVRDAVRPGGLTQRQADTLNGLIATL